MMKEKNATSASPLTSTFIIPYSIFDI